VEVEASTGEVEASTVKVEASTVKVEASTREVEVITTASTTTEEEPATMATLGASTTGI